MHVATTTQGIYTGANRGTTSISNGAAEAGPTDSVVLGSSAEEAGNSVSKASALSALPQGNDFSGAAILLAFGVGVALMIFAAGGHK